ncbi:MAG: hypothetical protein WB562_19780, partial [Candidatus Sulfotelmatobacter sp.]
YTDPTFQGDFNKYMAMGDTADASFQNFIDTGGFSPADIQAMYAAGNAPTRQIYSNAQDALTRANEISGGNLGNASVAQSRTALNEANSIGAVNTQTAANIAQLRQAGKEFGTTGLAATSMAQAQARTAVANLNNQLKVAGLAGMTQIEQDRLTGELTNAQINEQAGAANANIALGKINASNAAATIMGNVDYAKAQLPLNALAGLNTFYGTTPAAENMANNNLLNLFSANNQAQIGYNNNQIGAAGIPSGLQTALGNASSLMSLGGGGANALSKLLGGGSGGNTNTGLGMPNTPYTVNNPNANEAVPPDYSKPGVVDPNTGKLYSEEDPTMNPGNYDPYGQYNPGGGSAGTTQPAYNPYEDANYTDGGGATGWNPYGDPGPDWGG